MTLSIHVEAMAGDSINEVANEMLVLANRNHVNVTCDFNDVKLTMPMNGDPKTLVEEFYKAIKSSSDLKMAFGYGKKFISNPKGTRHA